MVNIEVRFEEKGHVPDKSGNITDPDKTLFPELSRRIISGEIKQEDIIHVTEGTISFCGLSEGMQSGRASFMIQFLLTEKNGTKRPVLIEASMRSFLVAAKLLNERFGNEI